MTVAEGSAEDSDGGLIAEREDRDNGRGVLMTAGRE